MIHRRGLVGLGLFMAAAPALIRPGLCMPISSCLIVPEPEPTLRLHSAGVDLDLIESMLRAGGLPADHTREDETHFVQVMLGCQNVVVTGPGLVVMALRRPGDVVEFLGGASYRVSPDRSLQLMVQEHDQRPIFDLPFA